MGEVWRGLHHQTGHAIALKLLSASHSARPGSLALFRSEIHTIAGLNHHHICAVYDHGVLQQTLAVQGACFPAGTPWFAMELAESSLRPHCGQLTWPMLYGILRSMLDALAHTHARDILHLDLKPGNILLVDGVIKLADFGIAKHLEGDDGHMVQGSPHYMAPEQAHADTRALGPWTDLFALGKTAWTLACGSPPRQIGPAMFAPTVPVPLGLEAWLRTLFSPEPADRFPSAAHATHALLRLGELAQGAALRRPTSRMGRMVASQTLQTLTEDVVSPSPSPMPVVRSRVLPLPADWRSPSAPVLLPGVGLGLFGLRAVPLVGRQSEQDALWEAARAVSAGGGLRGVVLSGEAGVGKSYLAKWLCRRLREVGAAATIAVRHSSPASATDGLLPALRHHLRLKGLSSSAVAEHLKERFSALSSRQRSICTTLLSPSVVPVSAGSHPLAVYQSAQVALLHALCAEGPLVLWLDDLQWGAAAQVLVRRLLEESAALPLLLVITIRGASSAVLQAHERLHMLPLQPLSRMDTRALVGQMLSLSPPTLTAVVSRTQGNPLFAIQLVGDWIERGLLQSDSKDFVLSAGAHVPIPDAIHDLWVVRLEQLLSQHAVSARVALELGGLLGVEVDEDEWSEVCQAAAVPNPQALLEALQRTGLAVTHQEGSWRFAHGLLVESIARIAQEQGRLDAQKKTVGEVLFLKGTKQSEQGNTLSAERTLARAEVLLHGSPHRRLWVQVLTSLSTERRILGQIHLAEQGYHQALDMATALESRPEMVLATRRLGYLQLMQGRMDESFRNYTTALSMYKALGDRSGEAAALTFLGLIHMRAGRSEEALRYCIDALEFERELGNQRQAVVLLNNIGLIKQNLYQAADSLHHYMMALTISREHDYLEGEGAVLGNLANLYWIQGQMEKAIQHCIEAIDCYKTLGHRRGEASAQGNLANLYHAQDRMDEAIHHYVAALANNREIGDRRGEAVVLSNLGQAFLEQGNQEAAHTHLQQALALLDEVDDPTIIAATKGSLGLLAARKGDFIGARALLDDGKAQLQKTEDRQELGKLLCRRCEVEQLAGEHNAARAALAQAQEHLVAIQAGAHSGLGVLIEVQRQKLKQANLDIE